jgi:hypothetical protein
VKLFRLLLVAAVALGGLAGCLTVGLVSEDGYSWSWINSNCTFDGYETRFTTYYENGYRRRESRSVRRYLCYDGNIRFIDDPDTYYGNRHRSRDRYNGGGIVRRDRDNEVDVPRNDNVGVDEPRNDNSPWNGGGWPGSNDRRNDNRRDDSPRNEPSPRNDPPPSEPPRSEPPRAEPPPSSPEPNDTLPPSSPEPEADTLPPGESRGARATAYESEVSVEAWKKASASSDFDSRIYDWAEKYGMKFERAAFALTALKHASHPRNDYSMLHEISLTKSEIKDFKAGKAITNETLNRVAAKLLMTPENLNRMYNDLQADYLQRLVTAKSKKK